MDEIENILFPGTAANALAEARKNIGVHTLAFTTKLSMQPLIEFWLQRQNDPNQHIARIAKEVRRLVDEKPSILSGYEKVSDFLSEHSEMLDFLFTGITPMTLSQSVLGFAAPPFIVEPFYLTDGLRSLFGKSNAIIEFKDFKFNRRISYQIRACLVILRKVYHQDLQLVLPYLIGLKESDGLTKYYKTTSITDFLTVKTKGEIPQLSQKKISQLLENIEDEELWMRTFSPDIFSFEGFFFVLLNDVTEVETLSRLRKILLGKESLMERNSLDEIAFLTRNYLELRDINLGISAIDYPSTLSIAHRYKIKFPILGKSARLLGSENQNSIYHRACLKKHIQIYHDLEKVSGRKPIEEALLLKGYKSLLVLPLFNQSKKIIGIMELASTREHAFSFDVTTKLKDILPLFDIAMEEGREFVDNQIQDIIQSKFTNIHRSVQWRFDDAAFNYLEARIQNKRISIEPIIFQNLYPLYGKIDMIGSSDMRNKCIQDDFRINLVLLSDLLLDIEKDIENPLVSKYLLQVEQFIIEMEENFSPGLEISISDMLETELHPVLEELADLEPQKKEVIQKYFLELDPYHGTVYRHRGVYENSINGANRIINQFLEDQEKIIQKIIPHYYEQHKTDGIEYDIFLGQSLLRNSSFRLHHLHNFRLWQIKSMCQLSKLIKDEMKNSPLKISFSFLIIVYSETLSIRFRMDEKRFDVEGINDIRYEVIKARSDKALLENTGERLVQYDKISIIYLQEKDKLEYKKYIKFLIEEGFLEELVEDLEIESMQGLQGLKALRISIL